jgi:hypothetical protein
MSDEVPTTRPTRRPQPRIPLAVATGVAVALGLVGYAVGHSQGASGRTATPAASSASCTAANSALTDQSSTVQASPDDTNAKRTMINLVLQNRSCFPPQLVAAAQTGLDNLNQGAAADAARDAAECAAGKFYAC